MVGISRGECGKSIRPFRSCTSPAARVLHCGSHKACPTACCWKSRFIPNTWLRRSRGCEPRACQASSPDAIDHDVLATMRRVFLQCIACLLQHAPRDAVLEGDETDQGRQLQL